jgi:hypothetical protein
MRVFRFDEEVSIPIIDHGSRFRIGPLTGDDSRVRAQVMHVRAGGLIGRHAAASPQLLAVHTPPPVAPIAARWLRFLTWAGNNVNHHV